MIPFCGAADIILWGGRETQCSVSAKRLSVQFWVSLQSLHVLPVAALVLRLVWKMAEWIFYRVMSQTLHLY